MMLVFWSKRPMWLAKSWPSVGWLKEGDSKPEWAASAISRWVQGYIQASLAVAS